MTGQSNEYRCDTCKKYPCETISNFDPEGIQMGREHAGDGCISVVGCASHSSFTAPKPTSSNCRYYPISGCGECPGAHLRDGTRFFCNRKKPYWTNEISYAEWKGDSFPAFCELPSHIRDAPKPVPDSKRLIEMAHQDYKKLNDLFKIDEGSYCTGWIAGFLSCEKPDWDKTRKCPGKWPRACSKCPDYLKQKCGNIIDAQREPATDDPCVVCPITLHGSHQCDGNPCAVKIIYSRKEHDAAIIRHARKQWERELKAPCGTISAVCTEKIKEVVSDTEKKAREDVLDSVIKVIEAEQQKQYAEFYPCWDEKTIEPIKSWGMSLEIIKQAAISLRQSTCPAPEKPKEE